MKTPEDIKKGLECCADPECVRDEVCLYAAGYKFPKCREILLVDAAMLVQELEKEVKRGRGEL